MWDDTPEHYRLMAESGVKHARVQTGWNRCEEKIGKYDFEWLDEIVDKLLKIGIQPWFNLGYGNIHHTESRHNDSVGWAPIRSETEKEGWTNFVSALVKHFKTRVTHYEVWNEPDLDCFWEGGSSPSEYMELLKLTVPVIKKAFSDAKIIGGATARGVSWTGQALLEEYLRQGFADLVDVYSFHRYHIHPELSRPCDFKALRAAFADYGKPEMKLWQGESGCPSKSSPTQALRNTPVNEEIQAKVLLRSIMTDLSADLDYTCYFHFSDFKFYYRNGFCDVPNHFGLVTFDDPPKKKKSYHAFQNLCSLFAAATKSAPRTVVNMMGFEDMENSKTRFSFQEKIINAKTAVFERNGSTMIVWWMPADLLPEVSGTNPFKPMKMNLHVWSPKGVMVDPVLIDPLTGNLFEIESDSESFLKTGEKSATILKNIQMKEYPMIAAEKKALKNLIAQ
jgi:hypothetical protein